MGQNALPLIQDAKLMNHLVFCNSITVRQSRCFVLANANLGGQFTDDEKKSIGAFGALCFKFVFGYKNQKKCFCSGWNSHLKAQRILIVRR